MATVMRNVASDVTVGRRHPYGTAQRGSRSRRSLHDHVVRPGQHADRSAYAFRRSGGHRGFRHVVLRLLRAVRSHRSEGVARRELLHRAAAPRALRRTRSEPVVVQITGVGPSATEFVNPASDPRHASGVVGATPGKNCWIVQRSVYSIQCSSRWPRIRNDSTTWRPSGDKSHLAKVFAFRCSSESGRRISITA
jgi:hypothetical protein